MNKERLVQLGKKIVEYVRARHVPPAIRNWRHRSSFARYLVRSLIVGIGVEIFLHFAHPYLPGISAAETAATDWAIRFWQDRRVDPQENHEQFTFVDIDEATYQRWGEPLGTPRDKVLQLVQFAVESRAKLVVVDIELTKRIGAIRDKNGTASPGGSEAPASGDADRRLANYLETYANQTDQSRVPGTATVRPTHILLVRTIGPRLMEKDGDSTASSTFRQERPSEFLEGIVSQSGTVHWASSLINRDPDGALRTWRLFEPTCIEREPSVIPSVALLAWSLIRKPRIEGDGYSVQRFKEELRRRFSPHRAECSDRPAVPGLAAETSHPGPWQLSDTVIQRPLVVSTHPSSLQQRIFYQFQNSSLQAAVYSRVRASIITDPPAGQPLNHDWLTDKIVIIGNSNEAARDLHPTPLGEMPGALVLINQINALLHYGQFLEVETWLKWPILIGLIIVFSMSFSFFTIVWGTRIARFVVNAMLVPLSLWLFQYGWWLDIVLPLIAVQLHRTIEELSGISDTLPPEVKDEAKAKSRPA